MSEEKGLISKASEVEIGVIGDDLINAPNLIEPFDGFFITQTVRYLDDHFADGLPEDYKIKSRSLIDEVLINKNYGEAIDEALDFLDTKVDIPLLDDPAEAALFDLLKMFIKSLLLSAKKKAA